MSRFTFLAIGLVVGLAVGLAAPGCAPASARGADPALDHFEAKVRPLLIERCHKCHSGDKPKGGLRLDSAAGIKLGGETGAAVVSGKPDESLLIQAVRHENGREMPPDGKLAESQIADLVAWVQAGAPWPDGDPAPGLAQAAPVPLVAVAPNAAELAAHLQLWFKAEDLVLADHDPVVVWPDASGHGRDLSATKGVRTGGVGLAGAFVKESAVQRRPAVRFDPTTGFATSPHAIPPIAGDAELTIGLVMNLGAHDVGPPFDGVICIGDPAAAADPGKPLAALVQINRQEDHALHFAGGWNHDASAGAGSFKSLYNRPVILLVTKRPGPIAKSTQIRVNGQALAATPEGALAGSEAVPDIRYRNDVGVYMGRATEWAGAIRGDVAEAIVYDRALADAERQGLELHLAEKYGIALPSQIEATRAAFTAEEKSHWAYQPVAVTAPPPVKDESWPVTPIDRFILSRLEAQSLAPAAPADKRALLRRATFDLTGLPPTPEEVAAFLKDDSPQSFDRAIDRLLDSPHYGEQWGRHWLDVVRYAESTANDANAVMRYAWRYRNYVIDALNRDLPYDQFLVEQLAGDLLPAGESLDDRIRRTIATGYLMIGPKALAETDKEQSRLDIVDDQIDVTGRAMLGLTLSCARCHDHKFDALRAVDYYALAGIFRSTEPFRDESRNSSMWWEFPLFQPPGEKPFMVMAPKETVPKNLRVHLRGNRFTLGALVPRGFPQVLAAAPAAIPPAQSGRLELARWIADKNNPLTARVMANRAWQHHFGRGLVETSDNFGTRGARPSHPELLDYLANYLVDNGWSLKALHRHIMRSNVYRQSSRISERARQADPDGRLLSHFAVRRLRAEELRDAMLATSGRLDREPGMNESAEKLWSLAEILDDKRGFAPNRMQADDPYYTEYRKRSVYLPVVRNILPDVLALFDAADPNGVTAVRNDTTVPSQSLFMLNSPFVRDQAKGLAERVLVEMKDAAGQPLTGSAADDARVQLAHQLAFGRDAAPAEAEQAREYVAAYLAATVAEARPETERRLAAWQSYCQTLLCANEFLYLE